MNFNQVNLKLKTKAVDYIVILQSISMMTISLIRANRMDMNTVLRWQ